MLFVIVIFFFQCVVHCTLIFNNDSAAGVSVERKFQKCAVVGVSSTLLNSSCGSFIDDAQFVVRLDTPVLEGYENDCGHKTTHLWLWQGARRAFQRASIQRLRSETFAAVLCASKFDVSCIDDSISTTSSWYTTMSSAVHELAGKSVSLSQRMQFPLVTAVLTSLIFCDDVTVYAADAPYCPYWPTYWRRSAREPLWSAAVYQNGVESEVLKRLLQPAAANAVQQIVRRHSSDLTLGKLSLHAGYCSKSDGAKPWSELQRDCSRRNRLSPLAPVSRSASGAHFLSSVASTSINASLSVYLPLLSHSIVWHPFLHFAGFQSAEDLPRDAVNRLQPYFRLLADLNGDGSVERDEFIQYWHAISRSQFQHLVNLIRTCDTDKDDVLRESELYVFAASQFHSASTIGAALRSLSAEDTISLNECVAAELLMRAIEREELLSALQSSAQQFRFGFWPLGDLDDDNETVEVMKIPSLDSKSVLDVSSVAPGSVSFSNRMSPDGKITLPDFELSEVCMPLADDFASGWLPPVCNEQWFCEYIELHRLMRANRALRRWLVVLPHPHVGVGNRIRGVIGAMFWSVITRRGLLVRHDAPEQGIEGANFSAILDLTRYFNLSLLNFTHVGGLGADRVPLRATKTHPSNHWRRDREDFWHRWNPDLTRYFPTVFLSQTIGPGYRHFSAANSNRKWRALATQASLPEEPQLFKFYRWKFEPCAYRALLRPKVHLQRQVCNLLAHSGTNAIKTNRDEEGSDLPGIAIHIRSMMVQWDREHNYTVDLDMRDQLSGIMECARGVRDVMIGAQQHLTDSGRNEQTLREYNFNKWYIAADNDTILQLALKKLPDLVNAAYAPPSSRVHAANQFADAPLADMLALSTGAFLIGSYGSTFSYEAAAMGALSRGLLIWACSPRVPRCNQMHGYQDNLLERPYAHCREVATAGVAEFRQLLRSVPFVQCE